MEVGVGGAGSTKTQKSPDKGDGGKEEVTDHSWVPAETIWELFWWKEASR